MSPASTPATLARVRTALEKVYRAFDGSVPKAIEGCPCCIRRRNTDALLGTPLRELSGTTLWPYASGAFLTVGAVDDFRYLLPRILDVSIHDPGNMLDPEVVLGKLDLARWRSWPSAEQEAIETFIDVWFDHALATDLSGAQQGEVASTDAEAVLCGAALAGMPLGSWLRRLAEPASAPVLDDLRQRHPHRFSPYWEDTPEGLEEVARFLQHP
jgi:hypothetical protein